MTAGRRRGGNVRKLNGAELISRSRRLRLLPIWLTRIAHPGLRRARMAVLTTACGDEDETVRAARARIDNTSPSGACFRLKVPIRSGTKAEVLCREKPIASKTSTRIAARALELGARELDSPPARPVDTPAGGSAKDSQGNSDPDTATEAAAVDADKDFHCQLCKSP